MFRRSVVLALSLSCGFLYAQTTNVSLVVSSYPLTTPAGFSGQAFSSVTLGLYYPAGLAPSSYVTSSQLNSDFQGFLSSYPTPSDAPEAYLSVAVQGIVNKYPQILALTLTASITGPPQMIGGVTIPGTGTPIGSISVALGNFSTSGILSTVTAGSGQTVTISSIASSWVVTLPVGFAGQAFSTVQLGVLYPIGLPSGSYITSTQLNTDFQSYISAYPTPTDAPEAYLSGALQGILNKYTQMPGGTLGASITGPPQVIGGVSIPGTGTPVGSINVAIGNFATAYGTLSAGLYGLTGIVSGINSSWAVTLPAGFSGPNFSSIQLGVTYPTGLPAASYITSKQLISDFQGYLSAFPSPGDAPEAYLSGDLQGILNKYPQMPGGTVIGLLAGQGSTIGGIPIPGPSAGTITVLIGTYSPINGVFGILSRGASLDALRRVAPAKASTPDLR
jgi:hypothetical protein